MKRVINILLGILASPFFITGMLSAYVYNSIRNGFITYDSLYDFLIGENNDI